MSLLVEVVVVDVGQAECVEGMSVGCHDLHEDYRVE